MATQTQLVDRSTKSRPTKSSKKDRTHSISANKIGRLYRPTKSNDLCMTLDRFLLTDFVGCLTSLQLSSSCHVVLQQCWVKSVVCLPG